MITNYKDVLKLDPVRCAKDMVRCARKLNDMNYVGYATLQAAPLQKAKVPGEERVLKCPVTHRRAITLKKPARSNNQLESNSFCTIGTDFFNTSWRIQSPYNVKLYNAHTMNYSTKNFGPTDVGIPGCHYPEEHWFQQSLIYDELHLFLVRYYNEIFLLSQDNPMRDFEVNLMHYHTIKKVLR